MMATQLKSSTESAVKATAAHKSAFFDPELLPWSDWVMPGTWFKLFQINPITGGFTMMLKVEPNNLAPIHGHFGAVEGWILDGGFSYEDDHGLTGHYVYEGAGIRHIPNTGPNGMIMFAVIHGPLGGFNDDGSVAGVVDARVMYDMAVANDAAAHIERPSHWV